MSERHVHYTYSYKCWLKQVGRRHAPPSYCTVHQVIFCLAFSSPWSPLVSLGRGAETLQIEISQFMQFSFLLPPLLCRICNKCPAHRLSYERT